MKFTQNIIFYLFILFNSTRLFANNFDGSFDSLGLKVKSNVPWMYNYDKAINHIENNDSSAALFSLEEQLKISSYSEYEYGKVYVQYQTLIWGTNNINRAYLFFNSLDENNYLIYGSKYFSEYIYKQSNITSEFLNDLKLLDDEYLANNLLIAYQLILPYKRGNDLKEKIELSKLIINNENPNLGKLNPNILNNLINKRYVNVEDNSEIKTKLDLIYKNILLYIKNNGNNVYLLSDIELDYNENIIVNKLLQTIKKQIHIQNELNNRLNEILSIHSDSIFLTILQSFLKYDAFDNGLMQATNYLIEFKNKNVANSNVNHVIDIHLKMFNLWSGELEESRFSSNTRRPQGKAYTAPDGNRGIFHP
ncbi:hypothetical protein CTM97_21495 [Photobacterium phosphoreum]|uniref:Uncharacterized protein n=1 Tax=Photobacterium phosphoreum TaxID=659 RepID=A0A2T3JP20_PHOPO|nr:hypothetical protein [Photobacterium phosphoreum]PSU26397.1 hypothetical protein CTM96_05130 [Photobacterium phosphoreum]PSU36571.1 hypothetical protein CTM97_21495 [Photobacterium phosphoreum]PSU50784.1 hypothetical protein C9J18_14140 [Photobacterium phosphoreum]